MIHIKLFEELNQEFEIGDYVVNTEYPNLFKDVQEFIKDAIGEIVEVTEPPYFYVKYDYPENLIKKYFNDPNLVKPMLIEGRYLRYATPEEIEKHIIEQKAKKYNL